MHNVEKRGPGGCRNNQNRAGSVLFGVTGGYVVTHSGNFQTLATV